MCYFPHLLDPPPGTDEIVALTKIVGFLEEGYRTPSGAVIRFDRVVLDTAPTGHTLRMLSLPSFLQTVVEKVRKIRDKTGSVGALLGGMGSGAGVGSGSGAAGERFGEDGTTDRLKEFERKMEVLEDMLHSPRDAEFVVVTIPTELAVAETVRLLQALQDESISLRRIIVNQVLPVQETLLGDQTGGSVVAETYMNRVRRGQLTSLTGSFSIIFHAVADLTLSEMS